MHTTADGSDKSTATFFLVLNHRSKTNLGEQFQNL
jgi:hypothetical protein